MTDPTICLSTSRLREGLQRAAVGIDGLTYQIRGEVGFSMHGRIDWLHADGAILPLGGVACRERRAKRRGALAIPLPDDLHKIRVTGKGADGGATIPRLLLGGSDRLHRNSIAVGRARNFGRSFMISLSKWWPQNRSWRMFRLWDFDG